MASGLPLGFPSSRSRSNSSLSIFSSMSSDAMSNVHRRLEALRSNDGRCGIDGRNARIALGGIAVVALVVMYEDLASSEDELAEGVGSCV